MIAKRLIDIILSASALVILLPIIAALGLWIKFDSPGPILFYQRRVGRSGRPFPLVKFRTMLATEPWRPRLTVAGDKRITTAGKFLRRYKLDELPQLYNVLKGQMSLVGPRPEVPEYVALYPADVRKKILSVPPGLTDFAALEFYDEEQLLASAADPEQAYIQTVLPRKLELYARYVDERSLLVDLRLLGRTITKIALGN